MAYNGITLSNSSLTNKRVDKGRNDSIIQSLSYLQKKQNDVLEKKDLVDTALEDIPALTEDTPALEAFKQQLKQSLSVIDDSKYVGDYDRQINKITAKTKKGIEEFSHNYTAQQKYIEEGKKAGLSDADLQRHLALSKVKGGLKYDAATGQFGNRFSGYSIAEPVDQKLVREAVATMKPSKYKFDDGNGNTIERETFNVVTPQEAAEYIKQQGSKMSENDKRELLASVSNHQNLESYYKTSPEFKKRQQFEKDYASLQASKLDINKLDDKQKEMVGSLMQRYKTNNPREAYAQYLAEEADNKGLNQVVDFAKLRTQNDEKSEWSERSKFGAMTQREIQLESIRHKHSQDNIFLKDALDQAAEKRKDEGLVINDASSVIKNDKVDSNDDGTLKEQSMLSRFGKKLVNTILPTGIPFDGSKKKIYSEAEINAKYADIGELAHNKEMRDNAAYKQNQALLDNPTATKEQKEKAQKENERFLLRDEEAIAKEVAGRTNYQVPLTKTISEKANKVYKNLIDQTIGGDLTGWGRSYNAKKINEDGTLSAKTDLGTLLDKESDIDFKDKEVKKALASEKGIVTLDAERGSDGDLGRGIQISIKNPETGKVERYAVEIPQGERVYKGKQSVLTEKEAINAKLNIRHQSGDKLIESYDKGAYTHYKVYDKNHKVIDTYNIDKSGKQIQ